MRLEGVRGLLRVVEDVAYQTRTRDYANRMPGTVVISQSKHGTIRSQVTYVMLNVKVV